MVNLLPMICAAIAGVMGIFAMMGMSAVREIERQTRARELESIRRKIPAPPKVWLEHLRDEYMKSDPLDPSATLDFILAVEEVQPVAKLFGPYAPTHKVGDRTYAGTGKVGTMPGEVWTAEAPHDYFGRPLPRHDYLGCYCKACSAEFGRRFGGGQAKRLAMKAAADPDYWAEQKRKLEEIQQKLDGRDEIDRILHDVGLPVPEKTQDEMRAAYSDGFDKGSITESP